MNEMHNKNEGFTLVELIIVVAIMGVLIALLAPVYARHVEKSRETVDIANVRSAYAEIMAEVMDEDASNIVKVVKLKQKRDNWKGIPVANGECEVSYNEATGFFLTGKAQAKIHLTQR